MNTVEARTVRLPYPPSANRYFRVNPATCRPYRSEAAKAYIEEVGLTLNAAGMNEPLIGPVSVAVVIHHAPGRRQDTDNTLKIMLDAMQGFLYADDRQIVRLEAEQAELPRGAEPYLLICVARAAEREVSS